MKSKLLLLATSSLLYANAQTAVGIAGEATSFNPTHHGDTNHAATNFKDVDSTAAIIHEKMVQSLRSDFDYLRTSITNGDDSEGFVREGIVFCGQGNPDTNQSLANIPVSFSTLTATSSLTIEDGFGGEQALNINEREVCEGNKCEEGSFVHALVNRIRSAGYHVTHSDVCAASSTSTWNHVPIQTCQLNGYKDQNGSDLSTISFQSDSDNNYLQTKRKCYKLVKDRCITDNDCTFTTQNTCVLSSTYESTLGQQVSTIAVDDTNGSGGPSLNEIRRATTYEDPIGNRLTDNVFVTGVQRSSTGGNNCKSLRQYVAALNGLAQINAFRDQGIAEGNVIWGSLIEKMMKNYRGIAIILNDFHAESVKMFPLIESEDMEQCAIGETEHSLYEIGTEKLPNCVKEEYDTVTPIEALDMSQKSIIRSQCFCREGGDLANADLPYLFFSQTKVTAKCTELQNDDENVYVDVEKYLCEPRIGKDLQEWKSFLVNLEPSGHKIMTYNDDNDTKKNDILDRLRATLNMVDVDNFSPSCGRLVSTTLGETSNKGANCVPFQKFNNVLSKMELATAPSDTFLITENNAINNIHKADESIQNFQNNDIKDSQIFEAALNVEIATGLKRSVHDANEVTWLALRDELTSMSTERIAYSIAVDAAENFMRITTTDSNDNAVDSTDAGANKDDQEDPTAISQ